MAENNTLLFVLVGCPLLMLTLLMIGAFFYYRRERTLTHTERMRALELGQPLPDDPETARIKAKASKSGVTSTGEPTTKSMAYQCYTITGWTSGTGLLFAMMAGAPMAYAIAAAAGAVGVTGMICGTILASKEMTSAPAMAMNKPRFDPEAV